MKYLEIKQVLRGLSSPDKAIKAKRFFKTGTGEYSANDVFIGVTTPELRKMAKPLVFISFDILKNLLNSSIHEERQLAIIILVNRFRKSDSQERKKIFKFYLKMKNKINNWDLVDISAAAILGTFCVEENSFSVMNKLINSKVHWDRRKAMVATHALIKKGKIDITLIYAKKVFSDKEDLMHKAAGWMLREVGKRDKRSLKKFIDHNGEKMPRTMLRYAIEHFTKSERIKILISTKA